MIENSIQKICPSCMITLQANGDAVDPDQLSIVTDHDDCDFDAE